MNLNDLAHWFPILQATGVPAPRTTIIPAGETLAEELFGKGDGVAMRALVAGLQEAAEPLGYPVFLRNGHGAGKHYWERTCRVPDADSMASHVYEIAEWGECTSIVGLPLCTWAVREMLPLVTTDRRASCRERVSSPV